MHSGDVPSQLALLFCLVLQKVVSAIATDSVCSELLFHAWYLDDGIVAGPQLAVKNALSIIQELGPPLGLFVNPTKCELFGLADLNSFPIEMKRSNVPHLEILGAPIGDLIFCAKIVAQKRAIALKLLNQLSEVGSVDPQVIKLDLPCRYSCDGPHTGDVSRIRQSSPGSLSQGTTPAAVVSSQFQRQKMLGVTGDAIAKLSFDTEHQEKRLQRIGTIGYAIGEVARGVFHGLTGLVADPVNGNTIWDSSRENCTTHIL
ncbi:hypothetical protein EMCRGX_G020899 [Ephydatia muelleri]